MKWNPGWKQNWARNIIIAVASGGMFFSGFGLGRVMDTHRQIAYQDELRPFCQEALSIVNDLEVRQYTGTVVARPSAMGYYGHWRPDTRMGDVVFFQIEGSTEPLMLLRRSGELPRPGDDLQFCGVRDGLGYWWPQIGYDHTKPTGRIYGEPVGPFEVVKWIEDSRC